MVEPGDPEREGLIARFPGYPGARSVVVAAVERVAVSCGYAAPNFDYRGERSHPVDHAEKSGAAIGRSCGICTSVTSPA